MHPKMLEDMKKEQMRRLGTPGRFYRRQAAPSFLPVALTGGIGDAILSRLTLKVLQERGLVPLAWSMHAKAVNCFEETSVQYGSIPAFSWYLKLDPMPRFEFSECFSGFTLPKHKKLFDGHLEWLESNGLLGHTVRTHSDQKWLQTDLAIELGLNAETLPLFSMGLGVHRGLKPPAREAAGDYITIHDGFDAQNELAVSGRSTKQWDWRHWNAVVAKIKKAYPGIQIKQLGTNAGRAIDGVDELLLGKTTITDAFALLSRGLLHIDTDSGLAHAATKLGVPCVVLFGPTPMDFYGHPENTNLSSQETCPGNCFWLTKNWMDKCPIGYPTPRCMDDISAERVFEAVTAVLSRSPVGASCA